MVRAGSPYWTMRAENAVREILDEIGGDSVSVRTRQLMELAYLQGVMLGTEKAMQDWEDARQKFADDLSRRIASLNLPKGA